MNSFKPRFERKYLIPKSKLDLVRKSFFLNSPAYDVRSVYLDSLDGIFLRSRLDSVEPRVKLRYRSYNEDPQLFLEVKASHRGRKYKWRQPVDGLKNHNLQTLLQFDLPDWVWLNMLSITLVPRLVVQYHRRVCELGPIRVTLDEGIQYKHWIGPRGFDSELTVLEVKSSEEPRNNEVSCFLRQLKIQPISFSKYCYSALQLGG